MNDYAHMGVDELFCEYAHWARDEAGTHWEIQGDKGVTVFDKNPLNAVARKHAIIAAIKIAVIREASVGVVKLSHNGAASDYDIVPKETVTVKAPEDTEVYAKMVKMMVYWKGRYEMAVRGMTDEAAVEIMGKAP